MSTKLQKLFIATALSTVGLCSTVASSSVTAAIPTYFDKMYSDQTYANQKYSEQNFVVVNKVTAITQLNTHGQINNVFKQETFAQMFDKPLVRIPLDNLPMQATKKASKKNEFFALATVFNDKLQQLIAKLTQSSPSYSVNDKGEMALNSSSNQGCRASKNS
ncbi:hypothetical protein [Colwellia sp. MEBiC06753]